MSRKPPHRISFHRREDILDLPNLIEIQIKSYNQFLQTEVPPEEREMTGLQEVFQEVFPIKSFDEKTVLEYLSYNLGVPKYLPEECIRRGITYSVTLRVKFRLTDETGIKEEEVYMGTIPIMTDRGTFIINGAERVVVSQLHRSPGICFEQERSSRGTRVFSLRIIPYRGSWLEASFDSSDCINIYIDRKKRKKKILATTFLRCLGLSSNADILEEFFTVKKGKIKSEKDFTKYVGKILAHDVVDEGNGLVYGKAAEKLTTAMLKRMLDAKIENISCCEDVDETHPIVRMLAKDPTDSYESALKDFYRKIRPGEPATLANARAAVMRLYFDPKRYNLGRVGRYRINTKLGFPISDEVLHQVTLRREDVVAALKYLIRLKSGDEGVMVDDIDHLGNRRVRSVGELVQNQCRTGLARMEKIIRERMNLFDFTSDTLTPGKIVSAKALATVLKDFFGRSQLSQFMDQTNPIAELTHKRRLSALGPGGLNRDRAGFDVRDVHSSHYGRICPIETPEGQNIGLITSLSAFAKVNEFGFIETPYRIVKDGIVSDEIEYMTADQEEPYVIAQATSQLDEHHMFKDARCWARHKGELLEIDTSLVTHVDVSPKQMVSIVTGLIPFLEHDDANRALMGSNMQRQAVPLLCPETPYVGTGLEGRAARDSGAVIVAEEDGVVEYVDGFKIVISSRQNRLKKKTYTLKKFLRSNSGSCINQRPICSVGDKIKAGDVIADGPATDRGEIAIGRNVLVAFMLWRGYNFEDAIVCSEKLLAKDYYTSIHIEEFEVTARETKLGKEEITRDIPNVSEEALANLGEDGVIRIGAEIKPGDLLVGKITPKSETELAPEERLLRAIFGEKAADVRDASLVTPPGTEGKIMAVDHYLKKEKIRSDEEYGEVATKLRDIQKEYKQKIQELRLERRDRMAALLLNETAPSSIVHRKSADVIVEQGVLIAAEHISALEKEALEDLILPKDQLWQELRSTLRASEIAFQNLDNEYKTELEVTKKGDTELESGVIQQVKVYVASKRRLQVGDKMAGRHGNKGVVSNIVQEADMPFLADGKTVEIVLNPLGVPSRMNIGQLLETHLGLVAHCAGIHVKAPVFEGFPEWKIWELMTEHGLPSSGKMFLYDGCTGERFDQPAVVGYIYMLKLSHLVADKIHARAVGPYSLVTQQPLGGKAQMGGQRFGEMEVWALEAYGAAHLLQEMLTVKSDDVAGRTRIYESIVKGENLLKTGTPESFNVLIKEMQGLGLDIRPEEIAGAVEAPAAATV
jgi:DNA-directed RNA polymerase subunit beta